MTSKQVYIGLSGGVDSAVSAALLKEQGHHVVGCFIKIWQPEFIECTWREDRLDAMRVCAALQIPYKEIDLSEEYKREVIEDMVDSYMQGITPNPDVLCNRKIKFGSFAEWAFRAGADFVATGHYARRNRDGNGYSLLRGTDTDKDQSYFLWRLSQTDLARVLFPVGHMTKPQVRNEAERRKLPVATKRDSQGLCFVGDITLPEFLSHYMSLKTGSVLDQNGVVVGTHEGAALYTIGQRHGFSHVGTEPRYVKSVDTMRNLITVSRCKYDTQSHGATVTDVHWIQEPPFPLQSDIQVRYRESAFAASTTRKDNSCRVSFEKPHLVAKGQSLVWYEGDKVLGGAVVEQTV